MKKAVILLSGGLDSTTCLALAKSEGFACYTLSFAYGQKHSIELKTASHIAHLMGAMEHRVVVLDTSLFSGSALTDDQIAVPNHQEGEDIPVTYVPARNTVFLSMALAFAESIQARDIFIGASSVDYSHYPDCRPEFIEAFQQLANIGTKAGVEGDRFQIHAPLQHLSKAETIALGISLKVDYRETVSCYQASELGEACGCCDSCILRNKGFKDAGMVDPTRYTKKESSLRET